MTDDTQLDLAAEPFGDARSVGELIADVNDVLKREFKDVWVYGEVGRVSRPAGGHCYFDLIDDEDGERKALSVNFFSGVQNRLAPKLRQHGIEIAAGIKVRIRGTPNVYAPSGKFGFTISDIDPRFTLGDLAAKREEIVSRLQKQGLYDRNKRTELPLVPLAIGLVTSKGSAAHADFMKTLEQSGIGFTVSLCDARVQGEGAAATVAAAITYLASTDVDLIAVVRGGGSKTDLAAFDDESLATAIARCPKPVFTGIGHEVDTSIADEVAYSWNKTPTACAVAIIERVGSFLMRVDAAAQRLAAVVLAALSAGERRVADAAGRLRTLRTSTLNAAASRIDVLEAEIASHDPVVLMRRGWSITHDANGRVLKSIHQAKNGAELTTRLADGTVTSTVRSTHGQEEK